MAGSGEIAGDPAAPASLAGIWHGIPGIRRHLPDVAEFRLNLSNFGTN
jgi:hypothetical protein